MINNSYTQICSDCKKEYTISLPDECRDCSLKSLLNSSYYKNATKDRKWNSRKRFAIVMLLTMVPLFSVGEIMGFKYELVALSFLAYGSFIYNIIDWIMKRL